MAKRDKKTGRYVPSPKGKRSKVNDHTPFAEGGPGIPTGWTPSDNKPLPETGFWKSFAQALRNPKIDRHGTKIEKGVYESNAKASIEINRKINEGQGIKASGLKKPKVTKEERSSTRSSASKAKQTKKKESDAPAKE